MSQADYNKILKLKYEYNSILYKQVEKCLLKAKPKRFELADKPNQILSRQLQGESQTSYS